MMAEALVKNPVCSKCGEDARPQALFCFACGGEVINIPDEGDVSSAWFKGDIVESEEAAETETPQPEENEPVDEAAKSDEESDEGTGSKKENEKVKAKAKEIEIPEDKKAPDAKLTSAAELRKRPKPIQSKRIEIVWKEKSESSNMLFVVSGLVLAALGALIFFAAVYLK